MEIQVATNKVKQNHMIGSIVLRRPETSRDHVEKLINSGMKYLGFTAVKHDCIRENSLNMGNNTNGFDCSGFFQFLLSGNGIDIFVKELSRTARYTREFYDYVGIHIGYGDHKRGDLVFFSYDGAMPTHMALYVGNNKILHKGFIDTSLTYTKPTGDYPKRIILSDIEVIANDRRNAGNPIIYKPERGPQIYFNNPIGFKRIV